MNDKGSLTISNSFTFMNVHEYQAKQLFADAGVTVPQGTVAQSADQIDQALTSFSADQAVVVKAQIHAGGRGKGTFTNGFKGGVHVVSNPSEAKEKAVAMLGNVLVTKQTGEDGKEVGTIYFTEASDIDKEFYLAILMDRATSKPVIIASTEGGVDIEEVAEKTPEKITKVLIDPALGIRSYQARQIAFSLELSGDSFKQCVKLVTKLYDFFWSKDCSQVEVNPLVLTPAGDVVALDAKVNFDSNALFRHPDVVELRDFTEEDPKEVEASKFDLNYIALDGNVACMVNGAGLAMATMDIIKYYGGSPANFLDVGGTADAARVETAFRLILQDPKVKAILVNIFGGIVRCDRVAQGIVDAYKNMGDAIKVPIIVRLQGTNADLAKELIDSSGLNVLAATAFQEAADKVSEVLA